MFRRVLIANRGEVAVRIVRACHELGVEAVAVYSTADRDSLHVRLADHAVHIGPPPPAESYLNIPSLVAAGTTTGCDAVHPGWGFLAERAEFAAACEDNDLVFVGPRPESIEVMGDKVRAKEAAAAAGLPLVPGSDGAVTLEEASALGREVGFPLVLKASAGGGGRGMRFVATPEELESVFRTAEAEAQAAFSDGSLYVERALVGARHVEIQVLGDGEGEVLTLGERDCSIQRRHQKLVEEGPVPGRLGRPPRRDGGRGQAGDGVASLPGCRDDRVPARCRRPLLLHRDEHPAAGRAPGHGARHGHRPRAGPAAGRRRPRAAADRPRGPPRPRDRVPDQRGGPRSRLPAGAGEGDALPAAARPGRPGRHPRRGGVRHPALLRLARREGDRLGGGPRRGAGDAPAAP